MKYTIDGEEYLDVDEAAALLGVKRATLYAYVSRGILCSYKQGVGRRRLYRLGDIEALRRVQRDGVHASLPADRVQRNVDLPEAASWAGDH